MMSAGKQEGPSRVHSKPIYDVFLNPLWILGEQQAQLALRAVQHVAKKTGQSGRIKRLAAAVRAGDNLSSGSVTLWTHG